MCRSACGLCSSSARCFNRVDGAGVSLELSTQKAQCRPMVALWPNTISAPLDSDHTTNFSKLDVAWRFKTTTSDHDPNSRGGTPLMVKGVCTRRPGIAGGRGAPPGNGELKWVTASTKARVAPPLQSAFPAAGSVWTDGQDERFCTHHRLPTVTSIQGLATIGVEFWQAGRIDRNGGGDYPVGAIPIDPVTVKIGSMRLPVSTGNVVIVGGTFSRAEAEHPTTHLH